MEETKVEKMKRGIQELQLDMNCTFHCEARKKLMLGENGIAPIEGMFGIKIVSLGFVAIETEIVNWFQEKRRNATEMFLSHTEAFKRGFGDTGGYGGGYGF